MKIRMKFWFFSHHYFSFVLALYFGMLMFNDFLHSGWKFFGFIGFKLYVNQLFCIIVFGVKCTCKALILELNFKPFWYFDAYYIRWCILEIHLILSLLNNCKSNCLIYYWKCKNVDYYISYNVIYYKIKFFIIITWWLYSVSKFIKF